MANLRFITEAPTSVYDRMDKRTEAMQAERMRDLDQRTKQQSYDFNAQEQPYKLRSVGAAAESAESGARVAKGTEGAKIGEAGSNARKAGTEADVAQFNYGETQANAPNVRKTNEANADKARTNADEVLFDFGEKQQTAPYKRREAAAGATKAEADATNAQGQETGITRRLYELFDKQMQALTRGDVNAAIAYAQESGHPIPPGVLADTRKQQAIATLWARTLQMSGGNPQKHLQLFQTTMAAFNKNGGNPNDALLNVDPTGVPTQTMAPLRASTTAAPSVSGNLSVNDKRLLAELEGLHKQRNTFGQVTGFDKPSIARELMDPRRPGGPRPDLARFYDPNVVPPAADTGSPLSNSMPMPQRTPSAGVPGTDSNPAAAPAAPTANRPPPEIMGRLRPGVGSRFMVNGVEQVWTLENGQPKQVR